MSDSTPTMLADRAIIRVSGDDVRSFLQGLVTNDTAGPLPVWAGLLTPQGKALFDFLLWEDGADVLIDCEAAQADALIRRLSIYRLRRAITIARDDTLAVHWSRSGERGVPDPRLPALGRRWIGAPGASAEGWLAHRLSLGVTEGVAELGDGTTLWLECNARELNGVSFAKGCYVGQENTARMHHRAKVNRRLVVAPLGEPGERTRASYPALGLMIELRRIEALGDALIPEWLSTALD
ncbi:MULTISPECIES: folate-binding protein [unclassified Sphingomonas]|uniref:CAF17-like 4Fe-4S cluster assembly/insertion protein YgfZ n=1 Tax=unclassified Sphingomonas TaxID=196159 RepID=UPI00092ACEB3|nr:MULTISPECIES: folate-binding protein [unclassified Sphingomonas]MBN8849479.1 folate-binding protein YgfZ [Sphingomonas sp.]OJV34527.1 MAG: folate-binding protein YgfZ [Sphingomonas sp. 67-36]